VGRPASARALAAVGRAGSAGALAALAVCWFCGPPPLPAQAQAATSVSIRPSLLPDRLGASTAFTLAFGLSGGREGIPAPLRRIVLHLPAGLGVDLRGGRTCTSSRLRSRGTAGCPSGTLLGRGQALLKVHAGSQVISEASTISAFRGANRGGHPTLEIFSQGQTPLYQSSISTAVLEADRAPYGSRLNIPVPRIPTLVYEPDASIVSFSLTIGAAGRPRAHAGRPITVPRRCPPGGFPFAADLTLADGSLLSATADVACP